MNKLNRFIPILTLMVLLLVTLTTSCDRRTPPPTSTVPPVGDIRVITNITATPDTIYNDNNITFAEISVTVKDGEDGGVPNQIVDFRTTLGKIIRYVTTDSTGVATTTLCNDGRTGAAKVTAVVRNYSTEGELIAEVDTTVTVQIRDVPPIEAVTLNFQSAQNPYVMGVMQSTEISAMAVNNLGNQVPNNTLITFSCTKGRFVDEQGNVLGLSVVSRTFNGRAYARYNAGAVATTSPGAENAVVTAAIGNVSSSREVQINPGMPAMIGLKSFVQIGGEMVEADTSFVTSPNHIFMRATLNDMHGNPCQIKPVRFETNLGTFVNTTQSITINTDHNGEARVRFTPGLTAGAATIKAFANNDTLQTQLIFNITSDDIHSINFTQESQLELAVANTGGLESAILRVRLNDINGNLIDFPDTVYFRIMNSAPPAGANLNNQPVSDSVMVVSTGGEAQVSVNSGTESGILIIRASLTNKAGRWVHATKANIVIHAGPPAFVLPFIGGYNTGQNMGGGLWRIVVGAVVKDVHGNAVQNNTAVFFSLVNPGETDCQIIGSAFVGNVSVEDDSLSGVAYTTLTYSGIYTNDVITIRASTGEGMGQGVDGYATVPLPLNDPRLDLQVNPAMLVFGNNSPDWKSTDIFAVLTDGQGQLIGNSALMLLCTKGQFVAIPGYNNNYPTDPPWRIITDDGSYGTGDFRGWAWGQIRFHRLEVPVGDENTQVPGQTLATITARLLGTNLTVSSDVVLYRYWTSGPPF